jgi:hypothetical protein
VTPRLFSVCSAAWRRVPPAALLALGWLVELVYAFPGYGSFDSQLQLEQARAGVYSDWHPPAMAVLWHYLDHVVAGPLGMLVVQTACFLAGAYLVLRRHLAPRLAAVIAGLVLWFPPVGATMAVIWKDSQMAGFTVLGAGLLLSERRTVRLAGLASLLAASLMRHNGFTVTLAIVVVGFTWSPAVRGVRRYAIAGAAWLAITAAASLVSAALTDVETHPWHETLALFDIAGTLRFAPPLSDAELRPILDGVPVVVSRDLQAKAIEVYSPRDAHFKVTDGGFLATPTTADQRAAVARAWQTLVRGHPGAYLWHRTLAFRELLRLGDRPPELLIQTFRGDANPQQLPVLGGLQHFEHWLAHQVQLTWLFRPYIYLAVLLVLSPLWVRDSTMLGVAASGLVSEAALFVASPTPDFRYSLWLVVTALLVTPMSIAAIAAIARRRRDLRRARS